MHQSASAVTTAPSVPDWRKKLEMLDIEACTPPWWARGGHAQTLLAHFIPETAAVPDYERVNIALADGDRLVGRYLAGRRSVVLYLFHGLGGSTMSSYMRAGMEIAAAKGLHAYAVNHRGQGEGAGLAAGLYHSGSADDLGAAIAFGRARHPDCLHMAVGFSLSGNALLLLMGGYSKHTPPDLALTVNAPIQLEKAAKALEHGAARLYDMRFVRRCTASVNQRYTDGLIPQPYRVPWHATLRDFDNIVTAPMGGFRNREHYYETCSAMPWLSKIRRPTVIVTSEDDPMVDHRDYLEAKLSSAVHFHLEPVGGHMGYLTRSNTPYGNRRWLSHMLDSYLEGLTGIFERGA